MRPLRVVSHRVVLPSAVVLAALLLAGCVPSEPKPTRSPSDTSTPSDSSTPSATSTPGASTTPTPTATAAPIAKSQPVTQGCTALVSNDAVYQFGPIFSAKSPAAPPAGSGAAQVAASGGRVCQWVNTSSKDTIDLGVGLYDSATIARLKAGASGGTAVTTWGADAAWFRVSGGVGTATAVVGGHWIVCSSVVFGQAGDADTFMANAVTAVR